MTTYYLKVVKICEDCGADITHGKLKKSYKSADNDPVEHEGMTCADVNIIKVET